MATRVCGGASSSGRCCTQRKADGLARSSRSQPWRLPSPPLHQLHSLQAGGVMCAARRGGPLADVEAAALGGDDWDLLSDSTLQVRLVQWYPGHIARAERQLREQLRMVDVVFEVRDARIPASTRHPQVPAWLGGRPRLLVLNRLDMVSPEDKAVWSQYYASRGQKVFWTDGNSGNGVQKLKAAALAAAESVNARRSRRGLLPRPVRAVVIGFPNVGKSALINRLLARRVCESAPKPGVTRSLRWARLGGELDMLDAPGVLPMSFTDQVAAQRLAMCNDIGEASYVDSLIAGALVATLRTLPKQAAYVAALGARYGVEVERRMSAEDYVLAVAEKLFQGETERAGARILKDFRTGALGRICLEAPPAKRGA